MKRILLFLLCCAAMSLCCGADLLIADGNKSTYQIVVQDPVANKALDKFIFLGGQLLQDTIFKATGAKLPLVREKERIPGKPAIFIGNTGVLAKQGLSAQKFSRWEHAIAVKGQDIYIYGKDLPSPRKNVKYPNWFFYYTTPSLKGACVFAEKFINTRFVGLVHNTYGLDDGIRTMPLKQIRVPANFSYRDKPRFFFTNGPIGGVIYSVANNHYFNSSEEYAVHYHARAIPQEKYAKTHPEYFALIDGKRHFHRGNGLDGIRPQYCLSNPDVQRLIYEEALKRADSGYSVVEFGQSDGFRGCECDRCKAWYNTSNWGEKLWCFHRDLALKLEKERPNVTPAISCYGPTHHNLPKSFKKFPTKRMIIDLAPVTPQHLAAWEKFNITGIVAWTYYFGSYLQSGYSPPRSFKELQHEVKKLAKTRVYALFNCDYRDAHSINGPWIYAYGKLCGNPELNADKLLEDYCRFGFGEKAAPEFIRFFKLINDRLEKYPLPAKNQDFNNFNQEMKMFALPFWNLRYPPQVIAQLEKIFAQALKKSDPENFMVKELIVGFDYMRFSAKAAHAAAAVQKNPSRPNLLKLADALEKRNAFIKNLPRSRKNPERVIGYPGSPREKNLQAGGYMFGVFGSPFDIAPELLRAVNKNIDAVRVKDFNDPVWAKIPSQPLRGLRARYPAVDASFKVGFNDEAILIKCQAPHPQAAAMTVPRDSTKLWKNPVWEIFLSNSDLNLRQMVFSSAPGSAYDSTFYSKQSFVKWNGSWSHKDTVKNGIWNSCVTIPFKTVYGRLPRQGEKLLMQFGFSPAGAPAHYAFNIPLSGAFNDVTGFAQVRFGNPPKPGTVRNIELNGDFKVNNKQGFPAGWVFLPKRSDSVILAGNNSVTLKKKGKAYQGLYSLNLVTADKDDECVFTAVLKGKGRVQLGAGWHRGDRRFAVNTADRIVTLTEKPQRLTWRFKCGINAVRKNAWAFQPVIFLLEADSWMTIEKIEVKVIHR
ncbi:MAG: DUF4838 domain-containing protein [Lentisphaeria bacterium]|nr:DUF4838 domain-containing protein [Lentisphaeria bacterium]